MLTAIATVAPQVQAVSSQAQTSAFIALAVCLVFIILLFGGIILSAVLQQEEEDRSNSRGGSGWIGEG